MIIRSEWKCPPKDLRRPAGDAILEPRKHIYDSSHLQAGVIVSCLVQHALVVLHDAL